MDTQPTFAELEYNQKQKTTHRERFWARMDALIPWEELEAEIDPFYPRRGQGRPAYPLAVMLRVHCLQLFYNRSDPGMEDDLYEMESLRRFAGLRLGGAIPDETTILNFAICWSGTAWARSCSAASTSIWPPADCACARAQSWIPR